jgi:hypothetical protein
MRFVAGLLLAVSLFAAGCSRTPTAAGGVTYRLGEQDSRLTMTFGQLTLVFEGIPAAAGASGTTGTLFVAGSGGGSVDVGGVSIKHKMADGVCTVTVSDAVTFKLTEGGAKLVIADKTYDLNEPRTVTVAKDGTPR